MSTMFLPKISNDPVWIQKERKLKNWSTLKDTK